MRASLWLPLLSVFLLACPDAVPGDPSGGASTGGSGAGSTGGSAGDGAAASGGNDVGGAPDFTSATSQLVAPPEADSSQYGYAVSVSADTVAVGAYREWHDLMTAGGVYVYTRNGASFEPQTVLHAQPPEAQSFFGYAISISGDSLWSTAPAYSEPVNLCGAAYALDRNGRSWVSQVMVQEEDAHESANFGRSVAVSGGTAVVGAPQVVSGQAHWYEKTGGQWLFGGELVPDEDIWDYGAGVAVDGDTILVGSRAVEDDPRTVFVFVRDGASWTQQDKLVPGNGGAGFGAAVSLSGDIAVVGSDEGAANRAYVFVRNGESWQQEAELGADDGEEGDGFGYAVAVSGNAVLVGAPYHDGGGVERGAAYVFARAGGSWSQQTKLSEASPDDDARFGTAVAIDGKIAVVGAVSNVTGEGRATIYVAP
jgi:hypothetical protein